LQVWDVRIRWNRFCQYITLRLFLRGKTSLLKAKEWHPDYSLSELPLDQNEARFYSTSKASQTMAHIIKVSNNVFNVPKHISDFTSYTKAARIDRLGPRSLITWIASRQLVSTMISSSVHCMASVKP
jgi:hypothetical protein